MYTNLLDFFLGFNLDFINEIMNSDFGIFGDDITDVFAFCEIQGLDGMDYFLLGSSCNEDLVLLGSAYFSEDI